MAVLPTNRRFACVVTAVCYALLSPAVAADDPGREFFEARIRPVLVRYCYECHSHAAVEPKGGLLLDSRDGIRQGGETGPAIVPGNLAGSLLIAALRRESLEMPPQERLPAEVIADFVRWVEMGAPDPRDAPPDASVAVRELWKAELDRRRQWWSLQPLVAPQLPSAPSGSASQPIDLFIQEKLAEHDLAPAPPADKRTLIRRLAFALLGLPPRPEEVATFVADESPDAYERLVDRLLDSPHFGERWARHWMDVVRYTDTYGYEWDIPAKGAWRYRDYLIRAFNGDVPFDQLVREQIAGDLLEQPRLNHQDQINESLIGLMFYQMGEKRHGDSSEFNGIHQEMLDNKIDAFSKAFQALTISCARCHDHKLDAVAQAEYYALGGSFMSSRWVTNTVDLPQRNAEVIAELQQIKRELRDVLAQTWLHDLGHLATRLDAVQGSREALEEPLYAWARLTQAASPSDIHDIWRKVAQAYAAETAKRNAENRAHFEFVVDFRQGIPEGWSVDGVGLRDVTPCGDFVVALAGDSAVESLLPGGLFTHVLSPRLNGAVRTPYLQSFSPGHISFESCGGDFAARRTVVDNAFLTEKQQYLANPQPQWHLMSTLSGQPQRHNYIEFATKTSNPNFPPRVGLGGACSEEQIADPRSWFGLTRVALHNAPFTPRDELRRFEPLFAGEAPTTMEQAARRYAAWFETAVHAWANGTPNEDHVRLINWLLTQRLLTNSVDPASQPLLASLVQRYRETERRLLEPWTVNGMADLDAGYDCRLNIRGDYDDLGEAVPRGYLAVLNEAARQFHDRGSGRRELAELIASADNPLTARVYVNRAWHWLFGTGIVATPSDFGHLGELPSHPQLLDYLATELVREGWSTKRLLRAIVLSQTWRQSGQIDQRAQAIDPKNRLLHHYPLRRLEAEAIRDAVLAVSGRLDPQLFGPPINPPRVHEDPQKRLFSGPPDGSGRRSIYTKVTIMEPAKFLATFNQPDPKIPTGHRDETTTPAQSLTLLNDPFIEQQAEFWARRLIAAKDTSAEDRMVRMFRTALGRSLQDQERRHWLRAADELAALHGVERAQQMDCVPLWTDLAHAMLNLKEFIYTR